MTDPIRMIFMGWDPTVLHRDSGLARQFLPFLLLLQPFGVLPQKRDLELWGRHFGAVREAMLPTAIGGEIGQKVFALIIGEGGKSLAVADQGRSMQHSIRDPWPSR